MARIQKPVKGGRTRLSNAVTHAIAKRIESEAARYDVSKSFVQANALAFAFGIPIEDTYKVNSVRRSDRVIKFRKRA